MRARKTARIALVAVACSMSAIAAQSEGAGAATPEGAPAALQTLDQQAAQSARQGLDWMAGLQKENGSWSNENYPAMTALALWAFTRSDHPDKAAVCAKAATFITQFAQKDGGIYKPASGGRGSGGLSTYNTAICMIALHTYDHITYAPLILKARKFMASCQLVGDSDDAGGFGYNQPPAKGAHDVLIKLMKRSRADLSNTGWAAQSMRVTQDLEDLRQGEAPVDIDWKASLAFVEKLQNQDKDDVENYGSFGYEKSGERGGTHVSKKSGTVKLNGYGSMTYAGVESMIYAQVDRTDPRVRSALEWAALNWSVEENPGMGTKGLFYYFNIMSKALSLNGTDTLRTPKGEVIPWKKELIDKLIAVQQPDGSWINKNNQFWEGDAVLVTAYAVLALEYANGQ